MTEVQRFLTFDARSKPRITRRLDNNAGSISDQTASNLINLMVEGIKESTIESISGSAALQKSELAQILIDFDRDLNNVSTSVYQDWIANTKKVASVSSFKINDRIDFHVYHDEPESNLIAVMALAIGMFDRCFIKNRSVTLNIYASLDDCKRRLPTIRISPTDLAKRSAGYTVSGVTDPSQHRIILTKKQEIIKLLFHEMIHFASLDAFMPRHQCPVLGTLDLPESFAEAGSVVLHSALVAILCSSAPSRAIRDLESMLRTEYLYSRRLATQILAYHGYSRQEMDDFPLTDKNHQSPIAIWEYVLYRTNLLSDAENLINCLINRDDHASQDMLKRQCIDNNLFKELSMDYLAPVGTTIDVSYIYHDIDWRLL